MRRAVAPVFSLCLLLATASSARAEAAGRSFDLTFRNGDVAIACTLALPPGPGPFPALVLLSGDGQQDRDWTFGKLKMAKALADGLGRRGIAVLRCDDRGTGGSGGGSEQQARYQDLCGDARAALGTLRSRPQIGKVGLLGHSGGSSVAVMTAAADPAAADFVISLSGPFVSGEEVLVAQAHSMPGIYRGAPSEPDAEASLAGERIARSIGVWVRTGAGLDELRAAWERIIRARVRSWPAERRLAAMKEKNADSEEALVAGAPDDILDEYRSPLGRDFVVYDPASDVARIACPLLVLFGEKDDHVSPALHRPPLLRALAAAKSADLTVRVVPEADHAYTTAALYEKGEVLPGLTDRVADWILARFAAAAAPPAVAASEQPDVRGRFFQPGKLRVLLLSGRNNHDWRSTTPFLRQLLVDTGRFDVRVVEEPDGLGARTLAPYDLVVSDYCGPRWAAGTEQALVDFVRGGKGLVVVHGAAYGFSGLDVLADRHLKTGIQEPPWNEHAQMVGGYWPKAPEKQFHGARHTFTVKLVDREHPVTGGLPASFPATDELYHQMVQLPTVHLLATAWSDPATGGTGREEPILWTNTFGKGRVYFTALGHEVAAMQNDYFKAALLRGAEWAATGAVTLPADTGGVKEAADALRVLVVTGGHDFPTSFYTLFEGRPDWRWDHAPSAAEAFAHEVVSRYDVLVFYDMTTQDPGEEARRNLQAFAEAGKGIVALHHAIAGYPRWPFWEELLGGRYLAEDAPGQSRSTYRHDVPLFVKTVGSHPIVDPVGPLQLVDETYKGLRVSPDVVPLLQIDHPDGDRYVGWTSPYPRSRVVYLQLGHDQRAHRSAAYRELVRNAILWSAGRLK